MRAMGRLLAVASLVVAALLAPFATTTARADDGAPIPSLRPPTTVLRHVDVPTRSAPPPAAEKRELVILVGGYQSCSCIDDGSFDMLTGRLIAAGYDVRRFGQDPEFPYDTYGPIDNSARNLRDEVRRLAPDYAGVHLVTHSMGGVVADRAFAAGLSADDGVLTYVSWSAPHNGSIAAVAARSVRIASGGDGGLVRESLLWLGMEADSPAARDLAVIRPIAPPQGVVRLDLRESTDVLVTAYDARDPGVESRVLKGGPDGHGGILTDPHAIDMTIGTIAARRVPPDTRSERLIASAERESHAVSTSALLLICVLTVAACLGALAFREPFRPVAVVASRVLPRGVRRRCA